ncbi:MAG: alpha/beta hydrolase [Bacteroidota bacterium]
MRPTRIFSWQILRPFLSRGFWILVLIAIVGYGGMGMWFVVNEQRLVLHPTRIVLPPENTPDFQFSRVELETKDDVRLVAWEMHCAAGDSSGVWILYFHGNAGNISDCVDRYRQLERLGVNVFAGDYRGFGESGGHPDEQGFYTDAETMFSYLTDVLRVRPNRIILYGHSLGAAIAIELAQRRDAGCLIVEGAFTSMTFLSQKLYPLLPVGLLGQFKFDSIDKVGALQLPKLIIHAVDDKTIPFAQGKALYDAAPPPKYFLSLHGGHMDCILSDDEIFLNGMRSFLVGVGIFPASHRATNSTAE